MVLHIHTDALYLSVPKAQSRCGGLFYLSDMPTNSMRTPLPENIPPPENSPLLVVSAIMNPVLASAADAELGAAYYNCQDKVNLRIILKEMVCKQLLTQVITYNSTAACITNKYFKQRRSKATDM